MSVELGVLMGCGAECCGLVCVCCAFCCCADVFLFFLQIFILICKSKILILFLCSDCLAICVFFMVDCSTIFYFDK